MYQCTYKLPGREKTFVAPTIPEAHKLFIKDYAEAAGEVKKVKIEKQDDKEGDEKSSEVEFEDI